MLKWEIRLTKDDMIIGEPDYLNDEIIIYNGLYGIPSYVMWYCAPDKTKTLYIGDEFRLGIYDDLRNVHWVEDYTIKTAVYDLIEKKYKIYAEAKVNVIFEKLKKIIHKIWSSNKDLPVDGYEVLLKTFKDKEVRAAGDLTLRIGYTQYSFDKSMHLLDILRKICKENLWEFYLRSDAIFLSEAFYLSDKHVIKTDIGEEHSKIIDSFHFQHVVMPGDLCEPGALYGDAGRVIWVKFYLGGNIGGIMEFMVYKHKDNYLSEEGFVETLSGIAYDLGKRQLNRDLKQDPIILGRIFGEYKNEHREKYISPKFSGEDKQFAKDLDKRIFETDFAKRKLFLGVTDIKKTTPYAGNGVGLLFPQGETNTLLLTAQGDREFALVGPNYFGGGDQIPYRESEKDFRLQLPNGWVMYIDKDGNTIIQTSDAAVDSKPSGDNAKTYIKLNTDGTIDIHTASKGQNVRINEGNLAVSLIGHTHPFSGHTHQFSALIPGPPSSTVIATPNIQGESDKHSKNLRCEQG